MIIGVDVGCLNVLNEQLKTGTYRMAANLFKALAKIDTEFLYNLYSFAPLHKDLLRSFGGNTFNKVLPSSKGFLDFFTPIAFYHDHVFQYWGLSQALPQFLQCPSLLFVHDLAFLYYPSFFSTKMISRSKSSIKKATSIITFSDKTKEDLLVHFGLTEDKIHCIYQGCDRDFFRQATFEKIERILNKYKIKRPYFLFVGQLKPIKNISFILKAFTLFHEDNPNFSLVLVGNGDLSATPDLSVTKNVFTLGCVPDADLPALYSGATGFLHPSLYEGFGHPVVEAMACGCPVVVSNRGSLPEIVGAAGIVIDLDSTTDLVNALITLAKKQRLQQRLKRLSLSQVTRYSWDRFAQQVVDVARNLAII